MFKCLIPILMYAASVPALCQTVSSKYQSGTIVAVKLHQNEKGEHDTDVVRYDVSVKVDNTIYVVLYTPPNGYNGVEFATGISKLFLVGGDTLTFNSLSGTTEVPILRRETVAKEDSLDWSKAPGQYYSMKLQNLSQKLNLSEDQQAKIKPILQQESGELGPFWANPVVSRREKLKKLEQVVRASDEKIKPILSQSQQEQLLQIRKEQKQELKKLLEEKASK